MGAAEGLNWYAVYVKSRHEFVTDDELREKGIETFLPSTYRMRQWKDRKKKVEFPLFPGYLFVQIQPLPEEFLSVLKTRGVVTFISFVPGRPAEVIAQEIESLRLVIESGRKIDIYPHLREGTKVRIRRGPIKGAEGILFKKENEDLFAVNINILGRCISVKIYADDLESA